MVEPSRRSRSSSVRDRDRRLPGAVRRALRSDHPGPGGTRRSSRSPNTPGGVHGGRRRLRAVSHAGLRGGRLPGPDRDASGSPAGGSRSTAIPDAPAVVVVHGYTACRRDGWVLLAAGMLHRHGFAVLAIDLRNHGDSGRTGGRHTGGIRESADVLGAWDWLVSERDLPPERIGLFGISLGAASVVIAAGDEPRGRGRLVGQRLRRLDDATRAELRRNHLPRFLLPGGRLIARLLDGPGLRAKSPLAAWARLGGRPVFVTHGTRRPAARCPLSPTSCDQAGERAGARVESWVVEGSATPARSSTTRPSTSAPGRLLRSVADRAGRGRARRDVVDVRIVVRHAVRMGRRTNLVLPEALVAEVDRIAGPRMRSAYIAEAVEARLRRDRLREVVERTAAPGRPRTTRSSPLPREVVAWVRARRAEVDRADRGGRDRCAIPGHDVRHRSPPRRSRPPFGGSQRSSRTATRSFVERGHRLRGLDRRPSSSDDPDLEAFLEAIEFVQPGPVHATSRRSLASRRASARLDAQPARCTDRRLRRLARRGGPDPEHPGLRAHAGPGRDLLSRSPSAARSRATRSSASWLIASGISPRSTIAMTSSNGTRRTRRSSVASGAASPVGQVGREVERRRSRR